MPQYLFARQGTQETREFFYHMKEAPSVGTVVEIEGEKWKRLFTMPQAAPNGLKPIDPHSQKQFTAKTGAMKGSIGELWDYSAEQSAKRAEKEGGVDKVKENYLKSYSKTRRGTPHMSQLAENQKKAKNDLEKALKGLGLSSTPV